MPELPSPPPRTHARWWALWRRDARKLQEAQKRAVWLQAELENVRKQAERERTGAGERAAAQLAAKLLPALDSLAEAEHGAQGKVREGLALVRADLERALAAEGLHPIPGVGHRFDPTLHDAAQRVARPCRQGEQPGLVVEHELRRGWTFRGKVLRPAMVRVVQLTEADEASPSPESPSKERETA